VGPVELRGIYVTPLRCVEIRAEADRRGMTVCSLVSQVLKDFLLESAARRDLIKTGALTHVCCPCRDAAPAQGSGRCCWCQEWVGRPALTRTG
jgi:hypothetical protein